MIEKNCVAGRLWTVQLGLVDLVRSLTGEFGTGETVSL